MLKSPAKESPKVPEKKKVTYQYDIKNNPVFRKLFENNLILDKSETIKGDKNGKK
jgi:hypothetical protein